MFAMSVIGMIAFTSCSETEQTESNQQTTFQRPTLPEMPTDEEMAIDLVYGELYNTNSLERKANIKCMTKSLIENSDGGYHVWACVNVNGQTFFVYHHNEYTQSGNTYVAVATAIPTTSCSCP